MTSDPTVHPTNQQTSVDKADQPSIHSPEHTDDAVIGYNPQPGPIQSIQSKGRQNMAPGQETIFPTYFKDRNRHDSDDDSDIEAGMGRPKISRAGEGRAHTREEHGPYGFSKEGSQHYTRASDAFRSQKPDSRRCETGRSSSHVEVEGMVYTRLQERPRETGTSVERPGEVKIAERRTHANESIARRPGNEDYYNRTSTSDATQHPDKQRYTSVERSHYRSQAEALDTHRIHQAQSLVYDLHKTLQNYDREKKDMIATTNAAIMKVEKAERRNRDLEAQLERQSEELRMTINQLRQAEALRQQTLELLETKTSELRGAQAFMSKEDSLSGADVIGMVKSLNAEILQVAAFMADSLEDLGKTQRDDGQVTPTQSAAGLGKYIIRALRFRQNKTEFDPMPVQIALQVCLVQACKRVVDSWVPGVPYHDQIFDIIYARVRDTEGQSISGRWRAMTRTQIRNIAGEDAHAKVMRIVTDEVIEVFRIAGYSTRDLRKNSYFDKFRERLDAIGRLTYRIQEAISEGLTSEDFYMSVVDVGEGFDPENMDDTFLQSGSAAKGERVAGTTDFGLSIQATKKGSPPTILKKPKVVLASAL